MNSQKGVTLTSLVIYVIVVLIVLGILSVITANLQNNVKEIYAEGTNNSEIDKFNLYFLKEVKRQGNEINTISSNEVVFKTQNKYTFSTNDECIYLNDNIKIAENIEKCTFSSSIVNDKTIITVVIKSINGEEKTIEFILNNGNYNVSYENEEDYIYKAENLELNTTNNI